MAKGTGRPSRRRTASGDGSDRRRFGFRMRQNKEGNEVTLCLGASCPVPCLSNQRDRGSAAGD